MAAHECVKSEGEGVEKEYQEAIRRLVYNSGQEFNYFFRLSFSAMSSLCLFLKEKYSSLLEDYKKTKKLYSESSFSNL